MFPLVVNMFSLLLKMYFRLGYVFPLVGNIFPLLGKLVFESQNICVPTNGKYLSSFWKNSFYRQKYVFVQREICFFHFPEHRFYMKIHMFPLVGKLFPVPELIFLTQRYVFPIVGNIFSLL